VANRAEWQTVHKFPWQTLNWIRMALSAVGKPPLILVMACLIAVAGSGWVVVPWLFAQSNEPHPPVRSPGTASFPGPAPASAQPASQENADPKGVASTDLNLNGTSLLLRAVGTSAGGQLYQSYLNIGFIADGKAEEVYEGDDVEALLLSVAKLVEVLDQDLKSLQDFQAAKKLDLDEDDRQAIAECRRIADLLQQQASELQTFWKSGDELHGAKYEATRKEAWQALRDFLDLQ